VRPETYEIPPHPGRDASVWPAPAKLNLFLHITGRRSDGYHLLQTVFQFLDLSDALRVTPRRDGVVRYLTPLPGLAAESDLVVRAARLLQEETATGFGADLELEKRLPVGGGLGGGSSDAATTLVALNQLWGTGLTAAELASLGLRLGADVPVFVHGHAAWAEGVGDRLTVVALPEPWYVVVVPPCAVATAEVFAAPELTRDCRPLTIESFISGQVDTTNVCEPVVCRRYPAVAEALVWLTRYGVARMTGTGACVFAAFKARGAAERVLNQLPRGWRGFVARGMNRSPLLARLDAGAA
jgi:4-diphosphocytidyl-2-C-methyl-D-erythritol kinase